MDRVSEWAILLGIISFSILLSFLAALKLPKQTEESYTGQSPTIIENTETGSDK